MGALVTGRERPHLRKNGDSPREHRPFLRKFGLARGSGTLALSLLIFPIGMATHEVLHLAVYSAFGVPASLVVTHWRLGLTGTAIFGLHAAPAASASVPLGVLVANNGLGPALAALLLLVLWAAVDGRSRVARTALLANVFALCFFAVIEVAYPLLEEVAHVDADLLLLPELNYGVVLLILGAMAISSGRGSATTPQLAA